MVPAVRSIVPQSGIGVSRLAGRRDDCLRTGVQDLRVDAGIRDQESIENFDYGSPRVASCSTNTKNSEDSPFPPANALRMGDCLLAPPDRYGHRISELGRLCGGPLDYGRSVVRTANCACRAQPAETACYTACGVSRERCSSNSRVSARQRRIASRDISARSAMAFSSS